MHIFQILFGRVGMSKELKIVLGLGALLLGTFYGLIYLTIFLIVR